MTWELMRDVVLLPECVFQIPVEFCPVPSPFEPVTVHEITFCEVHATVVDTPLCTRLGMTESVEVAVATHAAPLWLCPEGQVQLGP